jgi:hypothetical protein
MLLLVLALSGCCGLGDGACGSCGPLVCWESCKYCRCVDDIHTDIAARKCACQALSNCPQSSCDFDRGFTQAYVDLAHGATGALPPVPPERYWSVCFRTCGGHSRARDWYAGYSAGVASANGGLGAPCNNVASSGTYYDPGPGLAPKNADGWAGSPPCNTCGRW